VGVITDQKEPIVRTDVRFDAEKLLQAFQATADLPRKHHAVAVTSKPGASDPLLDGVAARRDEEMEYCVINKEFRGTYIEEILESLPFTYGRTRLMSIEPQKCYPVHSDDTIRYHLAVDTHPFAYIIFPSKKAIYNIPSDGYLYRMDARYLHTAINCGPLVRTHLVVISDEA
jgi:hypothetical protein